MSLKSKCPANPRNLSATQLSEPFRGSLGILLPIQTVSYSDSLPLSEPFRGSLQLHSNITAVSYSLYIPQIAMKANEYVSRRSESTPGLELH